MRKILSLFIVAMLVCVFSTACNEKQASPEALKQYEEVIYQDALKENENFKEASNTTYPSIVVTILDTESDKDFTKVYAIVNSTNYTFDGVKFNSDSSYCIPFRFDINKDGKLVKKWVPKEGSEFDKSILEMTDNNKSLAKKMMDTSNDVNVYQEGMDDLKEAALKNGLTEKEISFKLEKIPGYEEGVKYIKEDVPEGSVCVIKQKDYDALQEERKNLVPADKPGTHWVSRDCILWNEKTGICTDYILDYSK